MGMNTRSWPRSSFNVGYVVAIVLVLVSRSLAPGALALAAAMGINWLLQMTSMRGQLRAEALMRGMVGDDR